MKTLIITLIVSMCVGFYAHDTVKESINTHTSTIERAMLY